MVFSNAHSTAKTWLRLPRFMNTMHFGGTAAGENAPVDFGEAL
jgi:hypothetical protein